MTLRHVHVGGITHWLWRAVDEHGVVLDVFLRLCCLNWFRVGCSAVTDAKPYRHRFPMTIIQHAVWLYHRFSISYRDVQELLHQRGILVSHETLREWCIKFGPLFADGLRQREPRRGSLWLLDEVCTMVDGVRHWLWRAVDEHGFVLDILLQRHRDTEAAKAFMTRLLGEYDVPDRIFTDKLASYGAAIRQMRVWQRSITKR